MFQIIALKSWVCNGCFAGIHRAIPRPGVLILAVARPKARASTAADRAAAGAVSGVRGAAFGLGKVKDGAFSFATLLTALASDSESNILSTPSLLTLDNEEASILVGQEIPVVTGSTASSTNANPFQTITRQEVGIKLLFTPQINEGDAVQLNIEQEVSSFTW